MATAVGLTHFACIVKLAAPKTLYLAQESGNILYKPSFLLKFSIFVTVATSVGLEKFE